MTDAHPQPRPRAAAAVIRAMARELVRQQKEGTLIRASWTEDPSVLTVEGRIDLAMLALVTERAMSREFG